MHFTQKSFLNIYHARIMTIQQKIGMELTHFLSINTLKLTKYIRIKSMK